MRVENKLEEKYSSMYILSSKLKERLQLTKSDIISHC